MGTRTLILVRHGQYERSPDEKLTALGRSQAELLGARIAAMGLDSITSSMLPRARETAAIASRELPLPVRRTASLNECIPTPPRKPELWATEISDERWEKAVIRMEKALARFFRPSRSDRTDMLVFHGNMLRALTCRAMGWDSGAWSEMGIHHASLTTLEISRDRVRMVSFNDHGHLPEAYRTDH